jgi:hypothetical protein
MGHTVEAAKELKQLRERIERWRESRQGQGRMPEPLWAAAAAAARRHGTSRVASELKLGYAGLKLRVQRPPPRSSVPPPTPVAPGFVELRGAQLLGPTPPAAARIEYARPDGSRFTVTVPTGSNVDIPALLAALR